MRRTVRRIAILSAITTAFVTLSAGAASSPDMVVNAEGMPAPGPDGATGTWDYRINSDMEIICYDITVWGISANYQSPARTATHIHDAPAGTSGPPRVVFPNPVDAGDGTQRSTGCLQGPFTTGVLVDGVDTDAPERARLTLRGTGGP